MLAVDRLVDLGGELAAISPDTMKKLDTALPPIWSRANPADIAGDADADRYAVALECLLEDNANDAVLVMNVPTALASALDAAKSVIAVAERERDKRMPPKPVFTMWMGESGPASEAFEAANIPNYKTEFAAVYGFMHLVHYRQARDLLMATPPSMPTDFVPDPRRRAPGHRRRAAREAHLARSGRAHDGLVGLFDPDHARRAGARPDEAVAAARPHLAKGVPVVLKIQSPDIVHKSEVGVVSRRRGTSCCTTDEGRPFGAAL